MLLHTATAQEGKVITKTTTIINGDTTVTEQMIDIDDYQPYEGVIDSLPNLLEQLGIDSIVNEGMAQIRVQVESIDFDSLATDLQGQAREIGQFFEDLQLDSLLSNAFGQVRDLDIEIDDLVGNTGSTVSDKLGDALNRDGLLLIDRNNTVELSGKSLKINGEKQPTNIHDKYKRLWEDGTGTTLQAKDRISLEVIGEEVSRTRQRG